MRHAVRTPSDPLVDDRRDVAGWHRHRRDRPPSRRGTAFVHRGPASPHRPGGNRQLRADRLPAGDRPGLVAWPALSRWPRDRLRAGGQRRAGRRWKARATPASGYDIVRAFGADSRRAQHEPDGGVQVPPVPDPCEEPADLDRAELTADMASVRDHYDTVLSDYYSRMFGEFDAKVAEQHALLERLGVTARNGAAKAVDLGCGSGFQSIALARLGFQVLAIDFSQRLLAELRDRARGLPVGAIVGDIRDVAKLVPTTVELAVCRFRKGVYRKLRLAPEAVTVRLEQAGFTVERHQAPAGMVALVGVSVGQRHF